jgi:Tfp pilus assembly protein PilP
VKLGTENKFETWTAIILGVGALLSVGYWLTSSSTPGSTPPATAPKPTTATRSLINPLDPTIRFDLLESAQSVKYEGKGRNIFRAGAAAEIDIPKPVKNPTTPQPTQPAQPVGPPPINLKFFGVASRAGEAQRIFLSEGESIFVAREGDIVNSRYKVVKINPQSVEIEDLLNNNRQSIPLTQG